MQPRDHSPDQMAPGEGIHTYVIAEVNGHADLLRHLLGAIDRFARRMSITYRIVFIGDIIDYGPNSKQAMDIVNETLKRLPGSELILGDHEVHLLRLLDEVEWNERQKLLIGWMDKMGGSATLASYGFNGRPEELGHIKQMIGRDHVAMLRRASRYVELERHVLVHAALEPGIAPADQRPERMIFSNLSFVTYKDSFGKTVVHGGVASPSGTVESFPNRIAINTGAHRKRILSALHIDPRGSVWAISARLGRNDPAPIVTDYPPRRKAIPAPPSPEELATRAPQGPPRRPTDYVDHVPPRRGRPPRRSRPKVKP
ncbi:unnamed protein product [Ciceribacter sp. T2.26MG-112.2]|uniref:serine/threonine protein phosphatase n=1 Tax=Ciceribacter sp. T2.26MG-112.2 TaxID=3137154 RepID=UPI000E1A6312|nr:serine/threonine protein phosphatase [Ciceribacter naphthalenivorans]SSC73521.1 unnamed protein product [Ciceribacter naphthalenivorans]